MKTSAQIENIIKIITCNRNYKSTQIKRAALLSTMLLSLCIFPHHAQAMRAIDMENYIDLKTQMDIFLIEAGLTEKQFKEIHFARNNEQKSDVNYSDISASDSGFRKLPPEKSIFHQIGAENENNEKWTNDKGEEYVFNPSTNPPKLVKNAANVGTYNFSPESDPAGHYLLDVLPYLLWGNSESDSTTFEERFRLFEKAKDEITFIETVGVVKDGVDSYLQTSGRTAARKVRTAGRTTGQWIKKLKTDGIPPQVVARLKKIQADMDIENLTGKGSLDYKTLDDSKTSELMLDLISDNEQENMEVQKFKSTFLNIRQQQKEEQNTQSFNDDQRIKTSIRKNRAGGRPADVPDYHGPITRSGSTDGPITGPGTTDTEISGSATPPPFAIDLDRLKYGFGNYAYGTVAFGKSSISVMPAYRKDIAPYIIENKNLRKTLRLQRRTLSLGQPISFYGLKESVPSKDSAKSASLRYSDRVRVRSRDYGDYSYVAWGSWSGDKNTRINLVDTEGELQLYNHVRGGHWVYGRRLGVDDIPKSGSARYTGQVMGGYSAFGMDGMPDGTQEINSITGNINMTVTFRDGNNSLSGTMNLDRNGVSWATARFNTQNARANPNDPGFKASLNSEDGGRGGLRGSFFGFGSNAAEVGGNFFFLKGNKIGLANGIFRAKKQ